MRIVPILLVALGLFACSESLILKKALLAKKVVAAGTLLKLPLLGAKAAVKAKALAVKAGVAKVGLVKAGVAKAGLAKIGLAKASLGKAALIGAGVIPPFYTIPVAPVIPYALAPKIQKAAVVAPQIEVTAVPQEPIVNVDELLNVWNAASTAVGNKIGRIGHRIQGYNPLAKTISISTGEERSVDVEIGTNTPTSRFPAPAPAL